MDNLRVGTGRSLLASSREAVSEAVAEARAALGELEPGLVIVTCTVEHDAAAVFSALRELLPKTRIHGITTSLGVLSSDGVSSGPHGVVGVLLFASLSAVRFAVGHSDIEGDGVKSGRAAAEQIVAAGRGEKPALLLFHAAPGQEEGLLSGVAEVLPGVPAYGGSAADHAIAGEWSVFTDAGPRKNAVSIAALFGQVVACGTLIAPYRPAERVAKVTKVVGRSLKELDGKPAAEVLNRWLDGSLEYQLAEGGNILAQTALRPLGVKHDTPLGPHFVTIHPAYIDNTSHSVELFARIREGDEVFLMEGSAEGLIDVLGELFTRAAQSSGLRREQVRAGILIYCAGCAGSVGPSLDEGLRFHLQRELLSVPLLGMCTFGEQGHIPALGNVHQDLSVSLVLIGEPAS